VGGARVLAVDVLAFRVTGHGKKVRRIDPDTDGFVRARSAGTAFDRALALALWLEVRVRNVALTDLLRAAVERDPTGVADFRPASGTRGADQASEQPYGGGGESVPRASRSSRATGSAGAASLKKPARTREGATRTPRSGLEHGADYSRSRTLAPGDFVAPWVCGGPRRPAGTLRCADRRARSRPRTGPG
jgi:hypothetical protein